MPSDTPIDLDAFFAQSVPVELCNLAAFMGTTLEQRADSVWQDSGYGSIIEELLQTPNTGSSQQIEMERVIAAVELTGVMTVAEDRTLRAYDHDIIIDTEGVTLT